MNETNWMVLDQLIKAVDAHNQGYVGITKDGKFWRVELSPVTEYSRGT